MCSSTDATAGGSSSLASQRLMVSSPGQPAGVDRPDTRSDNGRMRDTDSIRARFVRALPEALRQLLTDAQVDQVVDRIVSALAEARAEIPALGVAAGDVAERVAAALADVATAREAVAVLGRLHLADLALAEACVVQDRAALDALDARIRQLEPALARTGLAAATIDEALQQLRVRLVTDDSGRRRIADYSGRGELAGWLRVSALRLASNLRREVHRETGLGPALAASLPAGDDNPRSLQLKQLCAEQVAPALAAAFADLTARERNLIRQHHVDGLRIGELAELYAVHRVTMARWLEAARAGLIAGFRTRLEQDLGLAPAEISSVLEFVHSRIELSVRSALATR